ncbi:MAG: M1 family metallopeptidase, partial [Planctomycetota bacterium]
MRISGRGGAWMWLPAVCLLSSALVADVAVKAPFDGPVHHPRIMPADFMNIRLELAFDWERESIQGRATHTLRVLQDGLRTLTLDAVRMTFTAVRDGEGRSLEHRAFDDRIEINLPNPAGAGDEIEITIAYQCVPEKGIYFVSPDPRYPDRPRQVWSQGEAEESRHWYPCFDSPAERVSSEVIATVPEPLEVLSNGVLRSVRENPDDGTRTFHWVQERAHVNYLITVVAGVYEKLEDSWDGIPVTSWHYRGDGERARRSFLLTADMMECFSSLFGPYPWSKYDQIVVRDFLWGGMENTTATTLTDRTLHEAEDEPSTSSRGLVAHELAHQWFGDLVTCRDWADLWLNESFATFCATLYTEHHLGRPEAQMERLDQKASYLSEDRESYRRPLSCRTYRDPEVMFDRHSYPKGARILQMLRHMLGDEPFFAGVREYLRRHAFLSVESAQLRRALEDHTGEPLAWFFDQWIRHGGHPELRVRKSYDPETGILTLDVEQTQQVDHLTPLFRLPVEVGIYGEGEQVVVKEIEVRHAQGTFTFQVPFRPSFVRFDRSSVLLMELDLEKPRGEWIEQLRRD